MPVKRLLLIGLTACLLGALALAGCADSPGETPQPAVVIQQSANTEGTGFSGRFGGDLMTAFRETENPVLSPASAQLALGLLQAGAAGETRAQLDTVLSGIDFGQWMGALGTKEYGPTVEVANSLWFAPGMTVNQPWLQTVTDDFGAESRTMDLTSNKAVTAINGWVEEKTHGRIPVLVNEPFAPDTAAVLLNALYFKGNWAEEFAPENTKDQPFRNASGGEVNVPTMHADDRELCWFSTGDCTGVALPYMGMGQWQLLCLLPNEGTDPERLAAQDFAALLDGGEYRPVNLSLPRFTLEGTYELNGALQAMGLTDLFTENADLTPMGTGPNGPLLVSEVLQKTYFSVDEVGTEAAAVTEILVDECAAIEEPREPIDVTFDRPFLCCLWCGEIGEPLFLAAVEELTAE